MTALTSVTSSAAAFVSQQTTALTKAAFNNTVNATKSVFGIKP